MFKEVNETVKNIFSHICLPPDAINYMKVYTNLQEENLFRDKISFAGMLVCTIKGNLFYFNFMEAY